MSRKPLTSQEADYRNDALTRGCPDPFAPMEIIPPPRVVKRTEPRPAVAPSRCPTCGVPR